MPEIHPLFEQLDSTEFVDLLRQHLLSLPASRFDLQQALQQGSMALPESLHVSLLKVERQPSGALIRVSLFFQSMIAGCNCADDPSPPDQLNEYASATLVLDAEKGLQQILID